MKIDKLLESTNVAKDLDDEDLIVIGKDVVLGYENDLASRKPWEDDLKTWTELALQIASKKTFPWNGAANIKYPLLATAAMQFAARAYPTLVPSNNQIVKCRIVGKDPDGQKAGRAKRVSTHMSFQVMEQMDDWEEDMDKLLITLPIAGTCFKKTYFDPQKQQNCSKLILPKALVVNYFCRKLDDAERITEVFYLSKRKVKERQNQGVYLDIDLGDPSADGEDKNTSVNNAFQNSGHEDDSTPYCFLEQHTFLDLDDDGYAEPYIVTVEVETQTVVRIVPRFDKDGVLVNEQQKVVSIEPIQYYTKYGFIPNPDGGFYDIGFGRLLGPLNNSANTIINQLVDAGSLSNLQAGFIGKGLRIKMGESRFQPGEWKAVNAIGDDLKKQIFPLPVREPSQVLFNLLDLLLKSGKELASVAEIFVGKMPGQNTPATTTMATIEQGMKVFTAVYKRVYRSLASEFRKIYKLNRTYMNVEEYIDVLDEPVQQSDYEGPENDILPGADPVAVSSQEKQAKLQAVGQILNLGTIDPMWFTQQYLEAHEIPNAQAALRQPQPQPDPKVEAMKMKAQIDAQKAQTDTMMAHEKMKMDQMTKEQERAHKAKLQQMELQSKQMESILAGRKANMELQASQAQHQMGMQQQAQQTQLDMAKQSANHQMQMKHQEEANKQKLAQNKSKETKPNANRNSK
jgi:chaperonin GroES